MSFICGSLHNQEKEEDNFEVLWGAAAPTATPKRCATKVSRRLSFCSKNNKDSKNPYANRGLEKFSALLADLDHKRQKILTQKGSEDISLVRFSYSENNDCKPIVVKLKDRKNHEILKPVFEATKVKALSAHNSKLESLPTNKSISHQVQEAKESANKAIKKGNNGFMAWEFMKLETWMRPSYYLPLFLVLILIFLALFGKSVAILCTSIGWYVIPSINELRDQSSSKAKSNSNTKGPKSMKKEYARKMSEKIVSSPTSVVLKKEYARKMSEKIVSSPTSVLNGPMNNDEDQGRRKSF